MNTPNELLNRYLRAETTEDEERQLEAFFDQNAPRGLEERLDRQIDGWNRVEKTTERRGRTVLMRWVTGVAASLLILFGSTAALTADLTPAQAAPRLVFCLLYTPCIAAVASVKRELGNKWAVIMVVNQCAVAWLCALLVRLAAVALF